MPHLDCSHLLAIVNNSVIHTYVAYSLYFWLTCIPLDKGPGVVYQGLMVVLFKIFFKRLNPEFNSGCTTLHTHQHFQCIIPSIFCVLDDNHSDLEISV
jgi:hypothetical protein